jgi:hypothetical protein
MKTQLSGGRVTNVKIMFFIIVDGESWAVREG